jgi:hypothetical protein
MHTLRFCRKPSTMPIYGAGNMFVDTSLDVLFERSGRIVVFRVGFNLIKNIPHCVRLKHNEEYL